MPRPSEDDLRDAGVPEEALDDRKELNEVGVVVDRKEEEFERVRDDAASLRDEAAELKDRARRERQDVEEDALTPDYDEDAAAAVKSRAEKLLAEAEEREPDIEQALQAWEAAKEDQGEVAATYVRQLAEPARAQLTAVVAGYEALVTDDRPLTAVYADTLRPALDRFNAIRKEIRHVVRLTGTDDRLVNYRQRRRLQDFVEEALEDPSPEAVLGLVLADVLDWSRSDRGPWAPMWREAGVDLLDRPIRRAIQHGEDATVDALQRDEFPIETGLR